MRVWAEAVDREIDADVKCPYCGAYLQTSYVIDGDSEQDELECPACGKDAELLTECMPIFSLFRKETGLRAAMRYDERGDT